MTKTCLSDAGEQSELTELTGTVDKWASLFIPSFKVKFKSGVGITGGGVKSLGVLSLRPQDFGLLALDELLRPCCFPGSCRMKQGKKENASQYNKKQK